MDNNIIDKYFNVKYTFTGESPKISIKLKDCYKSKKIPSLNGNCKEYYDYFLGKDVSDIVFNEYKPLMAYHYRIQWYIDTYDTNNQKLIDWLSAYKIRRKTSVKRKYSDTKFKEEFNRIANTVERKKKISDSSKKMWKCLRLTSVDKIKNMIHSNSRKQFSYNGIEMNSLEFIMASLLDSLDVKFEYERVFSFTNKKSYVPDFYIPELGMVIECYGDYWHANPRIYDSTSTVFRTPVSQIYKRDLAKKEIFEKNGMIFLYFWEYDIRNDLETIKETICNNISKKK